MAREDWATSEAQTGSIPTRRQPGVGQHMQCLMLQLLLGKQVCWAAHASRLPKMSLGRAEVLDVPAHLRPSLVCQLSLCSFLHVDDCPSSSCLGALHKGPNVLKSGLLLLLQTPLLLTSACSCLQ